MTLPFRRAAAPAPAQAATGDRGASVFPCRSPLTLPGRLLLVAVVLGMAAFAVFRLDSPRRDDPLALVAALFPTAMLALVFGTLLLQNRVEVRPEGLAVTVMGWKRRLRWQDVARVWARRDEVQVELHTRIFPPAVLRPGARHLHFRPRRSGRFLAAVARAHPAGRAVITLLD